MAQYCGNQSLCFKYVLLPMLWFCLIVCLQEVVLIIRYSLLISILYIFTHIYLMLNLKPLIG